MWKKQAPFGFSRQMVAAALAVSCSVAVTVMPSRADHPMLIREVPMEVSGYAEAATLDQDVQTADSTFQMITGTDPLIVHMEGLRRAYTQYGSNPEETEKLLNALKDRYMADANNASKFFDYGYAQLMFEGNKNGLFFLRKANDKLHSPYTSLAYGMAQVDIDLLVENASPDELTTRKMDVTYKLKDALVFNRDDRLPGIWPSYVRILEGLKPYKAYDSLRNEDVTTIYVPYGISSLSRNDMTATQLMAVASADTESTQADSSSEPSTVVEETCPSQVGLPPWTALAQSKNMDLDNDGRAESVNFFRTEAGQPYDVKVLDDKNRIIGSFTSYKAPYIIEDIEGDSKFELVVRQFEKDPYHPLYVYRWNGHCYAKDKTVVSFFQ